MQTYNPIERFAFEDARRKRNRTLLKGAVNGVIAFFFLYAMVNVVTFAAVAAGYDAEYHPILHFPIKFIFG